MNIQGRYCIKCKKFKRKNFDKNLIKEPFVCIYYEKSLCKNFIKIENYLNKYFPWSINTDIKSDTKFLKSDVIFKEDEEYICYAIKIKIPSGDSSITKSKEIWRCKDKKEASILKELLEDYKYYWMPIDLKPELFVEEIII